MIHLVSFIYLLHFVSSQNTPTIVEVSPSLIKDVNDTVELVCKARDVRRSAILWGRMRSSGTDSLATNQITVTPDERFTVQFENTSSILTSILRIDKVQHTDSAEYRCEIPTVGGSVTKVVMLQVRSPPYIIGNTTSSINTTLNGNVTFECYGGGYPIPEVTWTRENDRPLPNGALSLKGNFLKIYNVRKEDAGNYFCSVNNKVGNSVTKIYRLDVEYAPMVEPVQKRVGQAVGFVAQLECKIESPAAVVVTWLHDNIRVSNNQYYTQIQTAIDEPNRTAVLKVKVQEKKVYGLYTCVVSSKAGNGTATVQLYETETEVCSENCDTSSGHSIISMLDLKLSFSTVIILMFNWQNM